MRVSVVWYMVMSAIISWKCKSLMMFQNPWLKPYVNQCLLLRGEITGPTPSKEILVSILARPLLFMLTTGELFRSHQILVFMSALNHTSWQPFIIQYVPNGQINILNASFHFYQYVNLFMQDMTECHLEFLVANFFAKAMT